MDAALNSRFHFIRIELLVGSGARSGADGHDQLVIGSCGHDANLPQVRRCDLTRVSGPIKFERALSWQQPRKQATARGPLPSLRH